MADKLFQSHALGHDVGGGGTRGRKYKRIKIVKSTTPVTPIVQEYCNTGFDKNNFCIQLWL